MTVDNRVIMAGFLVEPEYFRKYSRSDPFPQIAAYKLEQRYVAGLQCCGAFVEVVASAAVSSFPSIPYLFLPGLKWGTGAEVRWVLPNFNVPVLKLLVRFLLTFIALMRRLAVGPAARICVYSAHTPLLLAAFLASRLRRTPFFVIIPDLPQYMHLPQQANPMFVAAKRLDGWLVSKLVARASGVSVVSKNIVTDVPAWNHLRYMVIEGLAPLDAGEVGQRDPDTTQRPYFLYAGALSTAYGVKALIEGFCASRVDADLVLCGRGELEQFINECARTDARVKYAGFLAPAELEKLQRDARGLLLTRDPREAYTRYSFPSKLIEYMVSGAPVLTTRLPSIPDEYFPFLNVIEDATARAIAAALETFVTQPRENVAARAAAGRDFVMRRCHPAASMKSFLAFMTCAT